VGSGGIVRDAEKRARVIDEVNQCAADLGLDNMGVIESPIQGAEGNVEFLALYGLRK
jgi:23S rRNA (cytidine1920-2'-O)/16S rRNA (cytidine1409-2'-O)-methyltransferase